jgi:hypothetical protein
MSLTLQAFEYVPRNDGNTFSDDITSVSSTMFKEAGVRCSCGSKKTFYNKYSFKSQHCATSMHKKYIERLNRTRPDILKELVELRKDIRALRVIETTTRTKEAQAQRELCELRLNIEDRDNVIRELVTDMEQMKEFIGEAERVLKTAKGIEDKNIMLEGRDITQSNIIKEYEKMAITILNKQGYDIE